MADELICKENAMNYVKSTGELKKLNQYKYFHNLTTPIEKLTKSIDWQTEMNLSSGELVKPSIPTEVFRITNRLAIFSSNSVIAIRLDYKKIPANSRRDHKYFYLRGSYHFIDKSKSIMC